MDGIERARHHEAQLFLGRLVRMNYAHELAVAKDHDLVTECEHNIKVFTYEEDADALFLLFVEDIVYGIRRVDVESSYRICGNDNVRIDGDLTSQEDLLDITARELSDCSIS